MHNDLGLNLKSARRHAGMTQLDVADKIGSPVTSVSDWERGTRTPGVQILIRMADAYGVTLDELVRGAKPALRVMHEGRSKEEWSSLGLLLKKAVRMLREKTPDSIERATTMVEAASMVAEGADSDS